MLDISHGICILYSAVVLWNLEMPMVWRGSCVNSPWKNCVDFHYMFAYNSYRRDACVCEVKVDGTAYFLIGGK